MARYSKIGVEVWSDAKFVRLSRPRPNAQTLWFYLMVNPARTALPGFLVVGEMGLAEGLDWPLPALRRCWREIEEQALARADWASRFLWIPNMAPRDPPNAPNVAKAWGRAMAQIPECPLRVEAQAAVDSFLEAMAQSIHRAFREGMGKDKGYSPFRLPPSSFQKTVVPPAAASPPATTGAERKGNGNDGPPGLGPARRSLADVENARLRFTSAVKDDEAYPTRAEKDRRVSYLLAQWIYNPEEELP